ncbi:44'-diapolycopene-44'-dial dehydrogenase, partial [Taenia solium]
ISKLKVPFVDIPPSSIEERKNVLRQLRTMLIDNEDELCKAIYADLRKSRIECLTCEILPLKLEITYLINNLDEWAGEKSVSSFLKDVLSPVLLFVNQWLEHGFVPPECGQFLV